MAQGQNLNCVKVDLNKQSECNGALQGAFLPKFTFPVRTGWKLTGITKPIMKNRDESEVFCLIFSFFLFVFLWVVISPQFTVSNYEK